MKTRTFRLLAMLIATCVVLQACNTRRITSSRKNEQRYNASRTDLAIVTDSTSNGSTEWSQLQIEFDASDTTQITPEVLQTLVDMLNGDTAASTQTKTHDVVLPRVKSITASHSKTTNETAVGTALIVTDADTTAEAVSQADTGAVCRGETAITGKPPNGFVWWLALITSFALVCFGIYIGLKRDRRQ